MSGVEREREPGSPRSLVDVVRRRAAEHPDRLLFCFLDEARGEESRITFGELHRLASAVAVELARRDLEGERALLLYPPGLDYVIALVGCLYAGVVAVPAYPPSGRSTRFSRTSERLFAIAADCGARVALSTGAIVDGTAATRRAVVGTDAVEWLALERRGLDEEARWHGDLPEAERIAVIQYTSGSTSAPKGVVLSHDNLLANSEQIRRAFGSTQATVGVSWLPFYHDMGLIGTVLQAIHSGCTGYLLSPMAFLMQPSRWLDAISRYGAEVSGGPNFAYDLAVERIDDDTRARLDLSKWRVAYCGAEPVRADTLERFAAAFEPCGFRREAFLPCFGLAEATLAVSAASLAEPPPVARFDLEALERRQARRVAETAERSRRLVGCGAPVAEETVVIVDPETHEACGHAEIGEIWVSGRNVAHGYWGRPEESEATFRARCPAVPDALFLRTGDLGFFEESSLYIAGRLKDLIVVRGRNHYPQDIERTAEEAHPALGRGAAAAFSMDVNDREELALVVELDARKDVDPDEVGRAVRDAVVEEHEVRPHTLVVAKLPAIARTSSGKVQRHACRQDLLDSRLAVLARLVEESPDAETRARPSPESPEPSLERLRGASLREIETLLVAAVARRARLAEDSIDVTAPFSSFGLDSAASLALLGELEAWLGGRLDPTLVWDYPSIAALSRFVAGEAKEPARPRGRAAARAGEMPIAIVGLGCRLPGAVSPEALWNLLARGEDAVGLPPPTRAGSGLTAAAGYLDGVDGFEPQFFGIAPKEAVYVDPQQRLLLEVAWEALEDAAVAPSELAGRPVGVFVGISSNEYGQFVLGGGDEEGLYASTGNALSVAANRISYLLDLGGPSVAVDTACSSSLVAVHLACTSLSSGESEVAIAGGVSLILTPFVTEQLRRGGFLSADGRCKSFDASADGYVRAEGCGVVVLKPLDTALADGSSIYAVLRGTAVNHDGRTNGLTAPSARAQSRVLARAYERASVDPATVSLLEAHGTGTALGDPIEVGALTRVFSGARRQSCALGSLKSNLGHLEAAAGIAGLIKSALALHRRKLPPTLHVSEPNRRLDIEASPFYLNDRLRDWARGASPRRAGVSSFGFGGANAHVVLEEAPELPLRPAGKGERPLHVLCLSARTGEALDALAARYAQHFAEHPELPVGDACFTANAGRHHHAHRLAVLGATTDELRRRLIDGDPAVRFRGRASRSSMPTVGLLFTGHGGQRPGMGGELYETQPVFREAYDRCAAVLDPAIGRSLREVMFGEQGAALEEMRIAQPALFALGIGLVELWRSWGVVPHAVIGHSFGEVLAATAAGALTIEDGARLVAERGRLLQSLPLGGAMVSVLAPAEALAERLATLGGGVEIAAINSATQTVVTGSGAPLDQLLDALTADGVEWRKLEIPRAAHSSAVDGVLDSFRRFAKELAFDRPQVSYVSCLHGRLLGADEAIDADYWTRALREPVRFRDGLGALGALGCDVVIEVGPHPELTRLVRKTKDFGKTVFLPSLERERGEWECLLGSLGEAYVRGVHVDWHGFDRLYGRRRVALPKYPFQRSSYWRQARLGAREAVAPLHPLLDRRLGSGSGELCFEKTFALETADVIRDHRVAETTVLPGVAYLEMAIAAAAISGRGEAVTVRELVFTKPLHIESDRPRETQLKIARAGASGESAFIVRSRAVGDLSDASWVEHASGRLAEAAAEAPTAPRSLDSIRARCQAEMSPTDLYEAYRRSGIDYGPSFRAVSNLRRNGHEAVAELKLPPGLGNGGFRLHPSMVDGALQALGALFMQESTENGGVQPLYLPFRVDEARIYGSTSELVYAHVRREQGSATRPKVARGDVTLLDGRGQVVGELTGIAALSAGALAAPDGPASWLYRAEWREVALGEERALPEGTWLLLSDSMGLALGLSRRLEAKGARVIRVEPGTGPLRRFSPTRLALDPQREGDFGGLVEELRRAEAPLEGVVLLWGFEPARDGELTAEGLEEAIARHGLGTLNLLKAIAVGFAGAELPELWLVTAGAQAVAPSPGPVNPEAAMAIGSLRVAAREYPRLLCRAVDLDAGVELSALVATLESELLREDAEQEVAWREGRRFAAGWAKMDPSGSAPITPRAEGVYLLTAGQSGITAELAESLIGSGGKPTLVLVNRTPLPPESEWARFGEGEDAVAARIRSVLRLRDRGATVWAVSADATDLEAMRGLWQEAERRFGPVHGVVHAAGVLRDAALAELDPQAAREVLEPKVRGAWVLHELTRDRDLDFFVLFSSVSGVFGNPGQASYAAANAYLDALAHYRRRLGLPALAIDWGSFGEVGLAANDLHRRAAARLGVAPLTNEEGRRAFRLALGLDVAQVGIVKRQEAHRAELPLPVPKAVGASVPAPASVENPSKAPELERLLAARLVSLVAGTLGLAEGEVDPDVNFMDLGFDSLMATKVQKDLEAETGLRLDPTLLFEHSTIESLGRYLAREHGEVFTKLLDAPSSYEPVSSPPESEPEPRARVAAPGSGRGEDLELRDEDVAIIGLACRVPGASDPDALWASLSAGTAAIGEVPKGRWFWRERVDANAAATARRGGWLDDVGRFDAGFFGLAEEDVLTLDPQQRLFIEVVWEAIERAGYRPDELAEDRVGVFAGVSTAEYNRVLEDSALRLDPRRIAGNTASMVANRVSYLFDFRGRSLAVDTACSSSLVALDLAMKSLRSKESAVAIAGGAHLTLDPTSTLLFERSGNLARGGPSRAFDDRSHGYYRGEGILAFVLKPLSRAAADGDTIWAVIKGSAVGHDGHAKAGLTAPSAKAQRAVALAAYEDAGVSPATVGFLEAHGTGTPLGDGLEIRALAPVLGADDRRRATCALGAVKTKLGHAEPASGLESLLSAVLALTSRALPPTAAVDEPNRHIDFEATPFYLSDRLRPWPRAGAPRRAAVHSFGFGGVSAHVVLEEAPEPPSPAEPEGGRLIALSGRTPAELDRRIQDLRRSLGDHPGVSLDDLATTLGRGRRHFDHRVAIVASSPSALAAKLGAASDPSLSPGELEALEVFRGARGAEDDAARSRAAAALRALPAGERDELRAVLPGRFVEDALAGLDVGDGESMSLSSRLAALARLYVVGATLDWPRIVSGRRIPLPTYPFARKTYWPGALVSSSARELGVATERESEPLHPASIETPIEAHLLALARLASGRDLEERDLERNFMELGIDSIASMRWVDLLEATTGVRVSPLDLFELGSFRELARVLAPRLAGRTLSLDGLETAPGRARREGEGFPSSPLQQAYLAARQADLPLAGRGCHVFAEIQLDEVLDGDRLETSFRALVRRHPVLRSAFLPDGRQVVVDATGELRIPLVDARSLEPQAREALAADLRQTLIHQIFDPERFPLFEVRALVLGAGDSRLLVSFDFLIVDFRSLSLLLRDWRALYEATTSVPEPPEYAFADYAESLDQLRSTNRYREDREYWMSRLEGFAPAPSLPLEREGLSVGRPEFATLATKLSATGWRRLSAKAREERVSPSALIAGAFAQILSSWSASERFSLNLPIFDRYPFHPRVDDVVGPFTSNLLLSVEWSPREQFWEQARALQRDLLEGLEHRLFTGVEVARELGRRRGSGLEPAGPVVLTSALHGVPLAGWGRIVTARSQTPHVWLDCQVFEDGSELRLRWDYAEALFDAEVVRGKFRELERFIASLSEAGPLAASAPASVASVEEISLTDLVSRQAAKSPGQRAVVAGCQYLTYGQLEASANRIARALVARGVRPREPVAVMNERGLGMVGAVLGILKAGAAYVPIDPRLPSRRIDYLVSQSGAALALVGESDPIDPSLASLPRLSVDGAEVASQSPEHLGVRRRPSDLAYIIYTSGSTGSPKGVMIDDGGAVNTIRDINDRFGVSRFDRVLGFSSLSFDLSVYDIFGTLAAGATLVSLCESPPRDPMKWYAQIEAEGVTVWSSVPSAMSMLLDGCEGVPGGDLPTLRLVMLSGDWIPLGLPDRIRARFPEATVVSLGGATEASIWSIFHVIDRVDPTWKSIPYGKPLTGQSVHVLSEALSPVPEGEPGELFIGGRGVALGYWRDEERTRRSFPTHPETGERLYRTGDLGRTLPDASIEFLGRKDLQVKIQGFRVELAEVEAALLSAPGVKAGAVTVRGDRFGERQLVAHFVPREKAPSRAELRDHMASLLPEYMVPRLFVERPELPLNTNGKIDRGALDESTP